MKFLNLKLVILLEHQNIKTFLQKAMFQIGLKKFFSLKTLKTQCHGHMLLLVSMEKKCLERLTKKNCKKKKENQKEFRVKGNKLYIKWKSSDNSFNS